MLYNKPGRISIAVRPMDQASITKYITDTFPSVEALVGSQEAGSPEIAWGDSFFMYDPDRKLEPNRKLPFATIVTKDYGDFDNASNLNRPGVFRLNIGVSKETYRSLFGPPPAPSPGSAVATCHDFTALDQILPHPVYARQSWISILNPSDATFQSQVQPLLSDAYNQAARKYAKFQADGWS
jgi:hypothetical protein